MNTFRNTPTVKIGLIGVSRDCFPLELTRRRLQEVLVECRKLKLPIVACKRVIETETDALAAAGEMREQGVTAVAFYLGNFGPEGPITICAQRLGLPFMLCAAAEESRKTLVEGRGDAFCGLLNASFNCGLRRLRPYIPERPVGLPKDIARMIADFGYVARVIIGIRNLKVFAFGPRPQDFFACNAPIQPLYDLGIEVMENSELDLFELFRAAADRKKEIETVAADMARELGAGNQMPQKLEALAQYELALMSFFENNLGSRQFGVFANKCWPAFEKAFGFVPCYVNSRMATRGIPVACETDIYGAVSEYLLQLATGRPVTLLDVNNTVPDDLPIKNLKGAARGDLFMGFHCGNTPSCCLCENYCMKYQLIMHRLMEPGKEPEITCGTLEGRIKPGPVTIARLGSNPDNQLKAYLAEGHVLDADPSSFGGIGVFAIPGFARFYRHVLIERQFPHHTAVGFQHAGAILFDALRLLGVPEVHVPRPPAVPYPTENPFR